MKLSRVLGRSAIYARDVEAVAGGRAGKRLANRVIGRALGKLTRGLWRR